ncbi:hypothetical protein ES703_86690 [subsurface metagenome]
MTPSVILVLSIISGGVAAWSASQNPTTWTIFGSRVIWNKQEEESWPLATSGSGERQAKPVLVWRILVKFSS